MAWRVALCACNGTLAWDGEAVGRALGLAEPPALFDRLPRDEIQRFIDWAAASGGPRLLVGCCGPTELFREAAGAAGVDPLMLTTLDVRESCFRPHRGSAEAGAKAARTLRATVRLAEAAERVPQMTVRVGSTVLVATDSPAGLDLARRLAQFAQPIVLLDETSAAFDGAAIHPLPWKTNWGRLVGVDGSLGAFRATVEHRQPLDLRTCIQCMRCVPVCHTSAITPGLRLRTELCDTCGDCLRACEHVGAIRIPRDERERITAGQVVVVTRDGAPPAPTRAGHHVLRDPSAVEVEGLAWKVFGLIGDFERPQYVRYDADTCAGGAAGHQACGRCIPACPYEAITRDPRNALRVAVDQAACEGCGACVATCPTSSLTFTDPPPATLHARLAALLAPLPGAAPGPPLTIAFHCPERGAAVFADAGRAGRPYPASVLPVPMACLRHVSEADILTAFRYGAAGVALVGCVACPHGERQALLDRAGTVRAFLDALGAGGDRVELVAGEGPEAIDRLGAFASALAPPPVAWDGADVEAPPAGRDALAAALRALMTASGREPGRTRVPPAAPFAFPDVRVAGCTLCRTCVNVCPSHAFRYDEDRLTLELRQVACVNCGLCATACPESVITLRPETFLAHRALEYQVVVQDETLRCIKCGTPFGNRRAVDVIEAKLLGMATFVETFGGNRRNLFRMCPTCRAVAATMEMQQGWEP
ncbi:MAG: 4Fe-4S dicluster domain-containing protein [Candidatus Rokuibacteriota bacterium]